MATYRIPLDTGDILVVSVEIEAAAEPDPTQVGASLLAALGIGRPATRGTPVRRGPAPVPEEDADKWLSRTSAESLKGE